MISFHKYSILFLFASVLSSTSAFCGTNTCKYVPTLFAPSKNHWKESSYFQTQLYARGIKKGSLRKNLDGTNIDKIPKTNKSSKKQKGKTNKVTTTSKQKVSNSVISPSLAQWAASNKSTTTTTKSLDSVKRSEEEESVSMYTSFEEKKDDDDVVVDASKSKKKKNTSERRSRQAQRNKEQELIRKKTQAIVLELEELLDVESNRDIDAILGKIRQLTESYNSNNNSNIGSYENISSTMKSLSSGQKRRDYRMVWAGSDEAICHVGTGLHKVPLARLQEVFMTIGKSRMEMYEVIRILGPFPNVKNTLKGDISTVKTKSSAVDLQSILRISYDSMIDGTGKEILAGKEDNIRNVELNTLFASEDIIICQIPSTVDIEKGNIYKDGFGSNGSNLLVFALEEDLDVKLEMLRVA